MSVQDVSFNQSASSRSQISQGPRLKSLHAVLEKSLSEVLTNFRYNGSCIDQIQRRNVSEKLNEFDALIEKAQRERSPEDQSPLDYPVSPPKILRAKTLPIKEEELNRLEKEFLKMSEENARLMSELKFKKERSTKVSSSVQEIIIEINKVVEVTTEIPVGEMQTIIETINNNSSTYLEESSVILNFGEEVEQTINDHAFNK
ncbi:11043_t:CDS:2 [Acaulospora morrowiae]|uniref:11043_t:CDS:1 n=1 Tax=Acaulospora morrowiae TaxID=94023 RepID=A0A9N9B5R4_9GLOM|nr:11043_t:CDS:2 [Acaulospora morrowiae]